MERAVAQLEALVPSTDGSVGLVSHAPLTTTDPTRFRGFSLDGTRGVLDSDSSNGSDNMTEHLGEIIHGGFGGKAEIRHASSEHHRGSASQSNSNCHESF